VSELHQLAATSASQSNPPKLLVMVCTYNERDNLPLLVDAIHQHVPYADILVIDDNSPDGTGVWAAQSQQQDHQLKVISRPEKQGLGTAIRQGLQYAMANGYERVVNLDADFSHDPATIPQLVNATITADNPLDVAIGSRYVPMGHITGLPLSRILMSRCINGYARLLLGLRIGDWSSSFRAYNTAYLHKLPWDKLQSRGYGALQELLWFLHQEGARIGELPIHYVNRKRGVSKISWREAAGALRALHRLASNRFATKSSPKN